jgi:isopentenyl-diphosphate Delta-isomerase
MDETKRKKEHLEISLKGDMENEEITSGFEEYRFVHNALPELDADSIDTGIEVSGKKLAAPLMIAPITGGTGDGGVINRRLAAAAAGAGIAMAVGSQRIALEDPGSRHTFTVRDTAPDMLLFANLGAIQLNYGYGVKQCREAVDMIGADGLMLHLNPMQEVFQDGGNRDFSGLADKIKNICKSVSFPVVVREVGFGISAGTAERLISCGVSGIDIGGAGGTSWIDIEAERSKDQMMARIAKTCRGWGIPAAECLEGMRGLKKDILIIASGGIRSGLYAAMAIALGADMAGIALPLLKAASVSEEKASALIDEYITGLRIAMFGIGAKNIEELKNTRYLKKKGRHI